MLHVSVAWVLKVGWRRYSVWERALNSDDFVVFFCRIRMFDGAFEHLYFSSWIGYYGILFVSNSYRHILLFMHIQSVRKVTLTGALSFTLIPSVTPQSWISLTADPGKLLRRQSKKDWEPVRCRCENADAFKWIETINLFIQQSRRIFVQSVRRNVLAWFRDAAFIRWNMEEKLSRSILKSGQIVLRSLFSLLD